MVTRYYIKKKELYSSVSEATSFILNLNELAYIVNIKCLALSRPTKVVQH